MSGKHAVKSSKKSLIIIICVVVLVAVIAGAVILFLNLSGKNNNSATTVPTVAASTTADNTNSTQNVSDSVSETTQHATKSGEASEPTEQGYTAETSSNDSEIVVPTISGEKQKPKFSATLIPYYAKDENSSEEYSLRDLFGSAYSGGGFTFNEDGTFIDGITSASANSGAYIVEGDSVVITYSNDKNVIATVTEWNGDVPAEITVNYGGIIVSFK